MRQLYQAKGDAKLAAAASRCATRVIRHQQLSSEKSRHLGLDVGAWGLMERRLFCAVKMSWLSV